MRAIFHNAKIELGQNRFTHHVFPTNDELEQAIANNDLTNLVEETGDLIWDAIALAVMVERDYGVSTKTLFGRLTHKLVARCPHVFGPRKNQDPQIAEQKTNHIKKKRARYVG